MKENILEAVVEEMEIGVLVIDAQLKPFYANRFFEKTFEIIDGVEKKTLSEVLEDKSIVEIIRQMLDDKDKQNQETSIQDKREKFFTVRLVKLTRKQDDKTSPSDIIILFFHDLAKEKRVETIKKDFVANVSHELKTPLASIKGYSSTLLDGALEDSTVLRKFITIIDRHANRMTSLIEDLLVLSMLESHQVPMRSELIDISILLKNIIHGFKKQAKDKSLVIVIDHAKGLPKVMGDRGRLEQVIVNLVDNAIKYTNNGTVTIRTMKTKDNMLRMDVEDTGMGIPDKDISRIFERFYRVDKGRSRMMGGTGLGLAIVKHIIQAHHGKIWVSSCVGKKTTFSFIIPCQ